jgi:hypothetical protein
MRSRAALLSATAFSAFLLLTACGGGGGDGGSSSQPPPSTNGNAGGGSSDNGGGSAPSATSAPTGTPPDSSATPCQSQPVVGGDLFVVDNAPVRVTLLANGGLTGGTFLFLYDFVFGIPTNNQQDKWGQVTPFPPTAPVGTSSDVKIQPPPPDLIHGDPVPSSYPKGVPIQLWLSLDDGNQPGPANISSTASIRKDLPRDPSHSASVVYRGDNTATVTFFASVGGPAFTVGLTNVSGKASTCTL